MPSVLTLVRRVSVRRRGGAGGEVRTASHSLPCWPHCSLQHRSVLCSGQRQLKQFVCICSLSVLNIFPPEYPTQLGRPAGEVTEDALVLDISSLEEGNGQVENSHIN